MGVHTMIPAVRTTTGTDPRVAQNVSGCRLNEGARASRYERRLRRLRKLLTAVAECADQAFMPLLGADMRHLVKALTPVRGLADLSDRAVLHGRYSMWEPSATDPTRATLWHWCDGIWCGLDMPADLRDGPRQMRCPAGTHVLQLLP